MSLISPELLWRAWESLYTPSECVLLLPRMPPWPRLSDTLLAAGRVLAEALGMPGPGYARSRS